MLTATSAHTTNPNTPESDMCLKVLHTVHLSNGEQMKVWATDPMDAINKANKLLSRTNN